MWTPPILTSFLIWHGNRLLRGEGPSLAGLERRLEVPLASRRRRTGDGLELVGPGEGRLCFGDWIEAQRGLGARRLLLAPNGAVVVIGASGPIAFYEAQVFRGAGSRLSADDVARFVARSDKGAEIQAALLWQNRTNFGYYQGEDWDGLVAALAQLPSDELVGLMDLTLNHVDFLDTDLPAWERLRAARQSRSATRVEYRPAAPADPRHWPGLDTQAERLAGLLGGLADCCDVHGDHHWRDHFRGCLAMLHDGPPDGHWLQPMTEGTDLSPAAIALFTCAWESHVFGGMGSFNDTPVRETDCGERLGEALYQALMPSLIAATNDGAAPQAQHQG